MGRRSIKGRLSAGEAKARTAAVRGRDGPRVDRRATETGGGFVRPRPDDFEGWIVIP